MRRRDLEALNADLTQRLEESETQRRALIGEVQQVKAMHVVIDKLFH